MSTPEPKAATLASLERGAWSLDPDHSEVSFVARTLWGAVAVRGAFTAYTGRVELAADPAVTLVITAASLDTGNAKRDEDLRSGDFFGVDAHPEVRFSASDVHLHDDHLHVTGTLAAGGTSVEIAPAAHLTVVDGDLEIDAVARVDMRALGMSAGPGAMIKAKAWLCVRGRLVPA